MTCLLGVARERARLVGLPVLFGRDGTRGSIGSAAAWTFEVPIDEG
jgi:hypothetical protein